MNFTSLQKTKKKKQIIFLVCIDGIFVIKTLNFWSFFEKDFFLF